MIVRKHLTLRNLNDEASTEEGIDATIDRGLARWKDRPLVIAVSLVSALPVFRSDDQVFVTMILDVEIAEPEQKEEFYVRGKWNDLKPV